MLGGDTDRTMHFDRLVKSMVWIIKDLGGNPGTSAAMAGFYALMRRSLRTPEKGADSIAWLLAGGASDVPSGSYVWNRAERKVDLPLSGTKASEAEVDELVEFVRSATL